MQAILLDHTNNVLKKVWFTKIGCGFSHILNAVWLTKDGCGFSHPVCLKMGEKPRVCRRNNVINEAKN